MTGVYEMCVCSSTREASIILNEVSIGEEGCEVCFQPIEKEV
jgi:hypothetical protein